jgi:catechol 2,3-dioxygenase-like lactoylglutathione lyase family enzyme
MLGEGTLFAAIAVKDLGQARSWYEEKLGMKPSIERPDGLIFECKDGSGFLLYQSGFAGTAKNTVAGWRVANLDAEMTELRARGVAFEEYDMPGVKTVNGVAEFPGGRGAWFKDGDGNILALNEM